MYHQKLIPAQNIHGVTGVSMDESWYNANAACIPDEGTNVYKYNNVTGICVVHCTKKTAEIKNQQIVINYKNIFVHVLSWFSSWSSTPFSFLVLFIFPFPLYSRFHSRAT